MRDKDRESGRFAIILAEDARKSDISDLIATPFAQSWVVTTASEVPAYRSIRPPKPPHSSSCGMNGDWLGTNQNTEYGGCRVSMEREAIGEPVHRSVSALVRLFNK